MTGGAGTNTDARSKYWSLIMNFPRARRASVVASAVRQQIWRKVTPIYFKAIGHVVPRLLRLVAGERSTIGGGIRVVGILSTATGIGQSARLCASALRNSGHSVATLNLSRLFSVDDGVYFEATDPDRSDGGGVSIYHLNPPMILLAMVAAGLRRYRRDLNVAYWAWEVPQLPASWLKALDLVDAVLVPSTFCQTTVAQVTDKPVVVVPHPLPIVAGRDAKTSGDPSCFRVLMVFNCGSSLYRKNPWATIRAFKRAFGPDSGAELVLKIGDGRQHAADLARLAAEIGDAPNIRIIDELMDDDALDRLMRSADVYMSLHRSEGFGLSVAEAIMREVPVIVTNWSGTTDFCPDHLAYCVDYDLVPVDDPHPVYAELRGAHWAEPSIEAAARHLVAVRQDPAAARARATTLRTLLIRRLSEQTYASAIETIVAQTAPVQRPLRSAHASD